jgi:hypothetical protein
VLKRVTDIKGAIVDAAITTVAKQISPINSYSFKAESYPVVAANTNSGSYFVAWSHDPIAVVTTGTTGQASTLFFLHNQQRFQPQEEARLGEAQLGEALLGEAQLAEAPLALAQPELAPRLASNLPQLLQQPLPVSQPPPASPQEHELRPIQLLPKPVAPPLVIFLPPPECLAVHGAFLLLHFLCWQTTDNDLVNDSFGNKTKFTLQPIFCKFNAKTSIEVFSCSIFSFQHQFVPIDMCRGTSAFGFPQEHNLRSCEYLLSISSSAFCELHYINERTCVYSSGVT